MRTHHTHLTEEELSLLDEQFRESPHGQRQQCNDDNGNTISPTKLAIFDFDSTLFLSPLLSSTLWDSWLVNAVTTENLLGPGFWRDIRSLPLAYDSVTGDNSVDKSVLWNGWWNEYVVMEARRAINDSHTLTVLLTGRRAHPFGPRIKQMLSTKNLDFDIVGLRPDPAIRDGDTNESLMNGLNFNEIPDTFSTTMDFKSSFILHLKSKVPTLQQIVLWDDRPSQIPVLENFVASLVDQDYFEQGSVESVMAVRPKYNPAWELDLVEAMITSHNQALEKALVSKAPPETVVVDNFGTRLGSYDPVQLVRRPFNPSACLYGSTGGGDDDYWVLRLAPSSVDSVRETFDAVYQQHVMKMKQQQPTWQFLHGEQPIFFGDIAFDYTSSSSSTIQRVKRKNAANDSKQEFTLVVTGWNIQSSPAFPTKNKEAPVLDQGLTLRVRILELDETDNLAPSSSSALLDNELILPLWYKPSTFQKLSTLPYHWTDSFGKYDGLQLKAYLDHVGLYGLSKKK